MPPHPRLKRLRYRAWHRGTKEADLLVGGFFDARHASWGEAELRWFESLIDEEDVEIMCWAFSTAPHPARYDGPMMDSFKLLDFVPVTK